MSTTRKLLFGLVCLGGAGTLLAQLPTARLLTIFPPGGKAGSTSEVTVAGIDLEDARAIHFSHSNITAVAQTNGAGKFLVNIGTNVPRGMYDARVIGRFGISNPRRFAVGDLDEVVEKQNDSAESAMELPLGSVVNGRADANAIDHYKFAGTKGQRIRIVCEAPKLDSRMDPSLILIDPGGRELKESRRGGVMEFTAAKDGSHLLKVYDFLFGGGNEHFYRLSINTNDSASGGPQRDDNDKIEKAGALTPPCEVTGEFYPAGDVDWYRFDAKKGDVWWLEVISQRLGLPTNPLLIVNDQEFDDMEANAGGVEFKTSSLDSVGRFEAKEDGPCKIQVRDLFNTAAPEPGRDYRLVIRKESPKFELIAMPYQAPAKKDSREMHVWSLVLRRGETIPIKVVAVRQDGFKGDISVQASDLPSGVTSSDLIIPGDKSSGILLLTASEAATNWTAQVRIIGNGKIEAKASTVIWNVPDYNNEPVRSRLADDFAVAVCDDVAPITIATAESRPYEVPASGKLAIPLNVIRRGEFNEAFKLKAAGVAALESLKEIEVKEKGTNATVELDLSQQKLSPGAYSFYLQGQTKGKYVNPVQKDKKKDVTVTVFSAPVRLKVSPPQTAQK